jgi:hypothetical protein
LQNSKVVVMESVTIGWDKNPDILP